MTTGALASSLIQNAVFDALNVSAFATALLGDRLYTFVPQGVAFPVGWLAFGTPAEDPIANSTFGRLGVISHLELHVYSVALGDDEALDIMTKAAELIHHSNLTVTGWAVPLVELQPSTLVVEDFNGRPMRHGIVPFDVHAVKSS